MFPTRLVTAGVAAMILGLASSAQDGGPVVVGERPELEGFRIEELRMALDLSLRYTTENVRGGDIERRRHRELEIRETFSLSTNGYIGHPNLLEFNLFGAFTGAQRNTDGGSIDRERGWEYETIGEYDVSTLILQSSDWPLTLYSRRNEAVISRQFGETFNITTEEHGARLTWRSEVVPMHFQYFHREEETRSRSRTADFGLIQDTFQWEGQAQPADNHDLSWSYTFDHVQQSSRAAGGGRNSRSFQRHDAQIAHVMTFGRDNQHSLRSTGHLYREDGLFDLERIRLQELLRLRHTSRFETNYNYTFDHTRRAGVNQTIHRGSAGFRYRLFESVVTTGDLGASHLALSDSGFTSTQIFGNVGAQYNKSVPYGRLSASAHFSASHQEDSSRNGATQIINEPHVFSISGIIILQRRLIDVGSIVVTDAAGIFTFAQGIDYTVIDLVDRVEIRRVIGGRIDEEQAVLVSYLVGAEPGHTTDTFGMRFTVRYDFDDGPLKGLGLYGRYFQQDQSRSNRQNLLPAADVREFVVGADYRIGRLSMLAEHQWHDSAISPFRATRAEARYTHPIGAGVLTAASSWYEIDRYEDDLRTRILTLSGRWNQQVTENLVFGAQLSWRDERDNAGMSLRGFEQQVDFSWRHRQTVVYGSARNAMLDGNGRNSDFQSLFLGVRREF